jgi:response regulator RpfG family c-di-GMP phosphodiesterase
LQDNYNHLNRIVTGIAHLAKSADLKTDNAVVEVDVGDILRWVMEQVQGLVEKTGIKTDIEIAGDVGRILIDKKSLTQSLLYIVRNEIHASPPESHLHIHLAEKNAEHIGITVTNPSHCTPARLSPALLQRHSGTSPEALINELYPARILLRSMGGELEITSSKGKGTICAVTIPRKWRSSLQQVDSLQLAMEISRKEARDALKNIQRIVTSLVETVPPGLKDAYDRLAGEVQELAVLCNRSLYLADDFNSRLEMQQDRLLQQESEQLATSEAILTICQNITRSMQVKNLFDPESGKRVVKYTLAIAKELKIPDIEQHSLYHAALLKDLALAFSRLDVIEQTAVTSREVAATLKERLNLLWKAVATIPFFIPACNLLLYRYERYDGNGGSFGLKGTDIPLGARILAVADAFDFLTSDRSPRGRTDPVLAVPQIVAESGLSYDPHVVSALLMLRQRNELEFRFMENKGEISRGVTVE